MTIKDIAAAFDMSMKEFAKLSGYSRRALYHDDIAYTARAIAVLGELTVYSEGVYKADKARALLKYEIRKKAIEALKERFEERGTA